MEIPNLSGGFQPSGSVSPGAVGRLIVLPLVQRTRFRTTSNAVRLLPLKPTQYTEVARAQKKRIRNKTDGPNVSSATSLIASGKDRPFRTNHLYSFFTHQDPNEPEKTKNAAEREFPTKARNRQISSSRVPGPESLVLSPESSVPRPSSLVPRP